MKFTAFLFTVTGRGAFPLDMLRYDRCCPHQQEDVSAMDDDREWSRQTVRSVVLMAFVPVGNRKEPTLGRWASFGWSVDPASIRAL